MRRSKTRTLEVMLFRALVTVLLTIPLRAIALEAGEFHLYGITKAGMAFDITPHFTEPFDHPANPVGDPESKRGFRSYFVRWGGCTEKADGQCISWKMLNRVGRCTVWLAPSYRISCASTPLPLSGATYAGEGLDESRVSGIADANKLYRSFLRKYDGARPVLAAVYRCTQGCSEALPATLIFLWLGD
jgi:hypothetical protein